jgi:hypothetical protein
MQPTKCRVNLDESLAGIVLKAAPRESDLRKSRSRRPGSGFEGIDGQVI